MYFDQLMCAFTGTHMSNNTVISNFLHHAHFGLIEKSVFLPPPAHRDKFIKNVQYIPVMAVSLKSINTVFSVNLVSKEELNLLLEISDF